jgi:hypothetical protein
MGSTAINAECLWRIYLVAVGTVGPKDKLPEMYLSNMLEMAEWYDAEIKKGQTFEYGKQGGGTYSTRRKTPVLTPTSAIPVIPPIPGTGIPGPISNPAVKPYKKEKEEPPKEATKDELRAKRRELLKARAKR